MIATVPSAWLEGLSATWLTVLLDTSIKGAVILSVAAVAAAVMRRMSAASRQVVWFLAMAGLLVLPVLSLTLPGWRILPDWAKIDLQSGGQAEQAPAAGISGQSRPDIEIAPPPWPVGAAHAYAPAGQAADLQGDPPAGQASTAPLASAPPPPAPAKSWQAKALPWAMGVWIMGAAIALAPLVLGKLSLWILRRSARPAKDNDWPELLDRAKAAIGLRQNVLLLVSRKPAMPMVWGLFSSRLLIPAEATDWSPQRKWVVLLHELAHVKRWDCATKLLAHVACSVYWFNPLCWIAFRLMQREAEAACDDLVLSSTGVPPVSSMGVSPMSPTGVPPVSIEIDSITSAAIQPCDYADHLLHIASGLRTGILSAHSSIAMARKSKLEGRLLAILDGRRNRRALTRWGLLLAAVLVAAVAVPLAVLKATAATPDGPDSASPSGPATTPASDAASPDGAGAQPGDTQANATPARIAELIEQLGDDNYKVRQKAQQALLQVGWPAIPAIEAAARNGDLERAQRARAIIAEITGTWSDPVDGIRCAVRPVKASFSPDEDIVADIVYRNVSRKPITICVCPDHLYTWVHLFVKTDDNVVVALGRHGTGTYPPLAPADFVMLQPGQTTASRQVITHAEHAKSQLKPGQYFLQAEINKINRMDKALHGLEEFIRTHHLPEPWCGGIETGSAPLIIAAQAAQGGPAPQPDNAASANAAVWLALLTKSPIRGLADYHHTVRTYPDPVAPLYKPVPIPYCELEIRRAKDQSRVARIRNTSEFDESDRRRIGQLPDGQYVVAICTGKQRLSNVASLVIDSKYDPAKEPPLRLVAIEPGPGLPGHFVGVRGTGPTPEDPKFGTWSVHCPDLVVDDVKRGLDGIVGSFFPLKPGSQFESMLDLRRYEPAIAIDKPLAMKAVFNQYVSNIVRLPAQQTLGRAWDEATDKALPAPEPQALLVGKVVGADDKPAKGYEVGLASGAGGKRFRENTDDAGAYKFFGVPAGAYQLLCNPPGAGRPSLAIGIAVKADKTVQVDLSFQRKFIMAGVVTHADGKPGSKIDVELGCKDPLSGVEFEDIATTDEHGRYALASPFGNVTYVMVNHARARQPDPQLQAGQNRVSYTLRMQNGRFVAFPAPTPATQPAPAAPQDIHAAVRVEANPIDAPASLACQGRVVDPNGKPVVGAEVAAMRFYWGHETLGTHYVQIGQTVTTGEDGKFEFSTRAAPSESPSLVVIARKDGLAMGWSRWPHTKAGADVTVKLSPALDPRGRPNTLKGAVVDEGGYPVADATVTAFLRKDSIDVIGLPAMKWLAARTGLDGRFELPAVPADAQAEFIVSSSDRPLFFTGSNPRPYGFGQYSTFKEARIVLPMGGRIKARVVDELTGKGIAGLSFEAAMIGSMWGLERDLAVSGPDGELHFGGLHFGGLRPGTWTLGAVCGPTDRTEWICPAASVEVQTGKTTRDVKLEATTGSMLALSLVDPNGRPISDTTVLLSTKDPAWARRCRTDSRGNARVRVLPGLIRAIWAMTVPGGWLIAEGAVAIDRGQTGELKIQAKLKSPSDVAQSAATDAPGTPTTGNGADEPPKVIRRVYDVRDLIVDIPSYKGPANYWDEFDPIITPMRPARPGDSERAKAERQAAEKRNLAELIDKIKRIDPNSWLPKGRIGRMAVSGGKDLVISQAAENHGRISSLIETLRNERFLQIRISFKFIQWPGSHAVGKSDDLPAWLSKNVKAKINEKTGLLALSGDEAESLLKHIHGEGEYRLLSMPMLTLYDGKQSYVCTVRQEAILLPRVDKKGEKALMYIPSGATADIKSMVDPQRKSVVCDLATWVAERAFQADVPGVAVAEAKAAFTVPDKAAMLLRVEMVKHKIEGAKQVADMDGAAKMEVQHSPIETGKQEKNYTYILIQPETVGPATQPAPTAAELPMHMPATRSATQPAAARGKARIDGTVINVVTGLPVSGVPLLVSLEPDGESTTRSDQQGRFSLSGLEAGTYSIAVAREAGKEPDWVHEELRVKAEEGRPVVARLEVRRGGLLEVEVVGADTGRSVKNAWVNLREEPQVRPQRNYAGYSEAGGKVLVRLLPGSYIIRDVFENTSPPKRTYAPIYVNAEFAVAEGETHKVKVALPLVPRLKGEVADPDGKPVAGATVCLGPSAMAASVVTGPDGRFELPVVDIPGRNRDGTTIPSTLLVQAQARTLAALVRFVDVEKSVKVQLSPGTVMVGQVVSEEPNKKPLAGIPWQATLLGPGRPADLAELWYAPEEWYKTDAEGRFTTPVLPAGFRYIIRVNGDDRHLATRPFSFNNVIVQANVAKAGTADLGEVVLQKADRSISGTVVDSNGRPVPGAVVRSQGSSLGTWFGQFKGHQPYREVRADSRGRFMLEGICQGRAWLHVQEPGGARGEEFVHVGQDAEDVVIIVRSGGTIAPVAPATPPTTMPDAPMHMPANQPAAAMDDATAARVDQLKKAVGSFDLTLSACNDSIAGSGRMSNRQVVREVVWNLRVGPGQPAARQPGQVDLTPQEAYAAIDLLARQGLLAHKDKFAPSVGKPYLRLELNGVKLIQGTTDEPVLATFLGALPKVLTPAAAGKIAASAKAISAAAPGATTKPAPLGPAETPEQLARRGQIEGIAARLLAAMVKGDIPAAEMLCEGPVLGWKDESYGPPEEFKASISPAGLNTWRLKRSAGSIRGELQNARASLGGVLKTYLTDDEAVVIVKTWHDWGRFLAVTLRCHGGRWLVHDVQDTPAHLTLIGGLCDNMPAKPEPPKTAITDLQAVSLLRGVVLDLDNGSFSLPPTPPVLRAWDIKLDANGENFVRHNDNVKLLALDDARDFLDASRLAGQRMDRLQTGEQNSLPAKTRFFCVATESEEHKRNLAVVEVLGEPDENPVMIWTCRKVAWPARARVSDRSALVAGARTVNEQIALYEVQHLDHMPGLDAKGQFDGQLFDDHLTMRTDYEGKLYRGKGRIDDYPCGPYLDRMPSNPFVAASGAASLVKGGPGPAPKDGASGWWFDTEAKAFGPNHLPSAEPAATQPASSANIMADPAAASTEPAKQVEASASEAEVTAEGVRLQWGQCQPVKSPATMTAQVSYGKMLPVLLAAGAGDKQGIIRLAFAVFRKTDDAITAELYGQLISWPKSKWRVAMELLPDSGKAVRHQAVVENSGEVMGGMVFTDTGHLDFRFAAAKDLSADRFKVTLEPAAPADPVTGSFTPPDYEALKKKWDYRKSPGPGTIAVDLPLMPRKLSVVDTLWRQVSEEQETDLSILLAHGRNLYWRSDNGTFRSIALFFGSHGPAGREFTETNLPKGVYRMNADTQPNKPGAVFLAGSTGPVDLTGKNNIGKSRIEWFDRASLTVRVVDPQTGKPSIMVPMVVRLPNGLPISTVTDARGLRRLDFLPEGKLAIELGVRDWWSLVHPEVIKTVTVDVRAGQNDTLTIKYAADRPTYQCAPTGKPAKAKD